MKGLGSGVKRSTIRKLTMANNIKLKGSSLRSRTNGWGPKPFKIMDWWLKDKSFQNMVVYNWSNYHPIGWGGFVLKQKLKFIKNHIRQWSLQNGATKIQNLKKDLNALEAGVNGSNISQAKMELKKSLQEQLWTTAIAYESMMRQKSRVKWIKEGDTNSAYFHRLINHRRRVSDTWEWSADPEGQYSTRSAYDLIGEEATDSSQEECFEKLWRIKVPARFLVFAWRLLRDRLPTRKNLQRRQIQLTDSLCPLCRTQQEDASHLFFHCSKVQPIWWETMSWLQVKGAFPLSPQQHFHHHLGVQPTGVRNNRWHCWWLALTWSIWKLRNSIVFSNANFDANNLFKEAIFLLWSWLRGFEKDLTVHFNHWSRNLPKSFMYQQGIA
ncbi:putative ribonuclease H protein [Glycine soja]